MLGTGTRVPVSIPGTRVPVQYPGTRVLISTRVKLVQVGQLSQANRAAACISFGKNISAKRQKWSGYYSGLIDEKRSCSRDSDRYRRLKRQVRSSLRRDKRNHLESVCEEMEEYQKRNDSKGMFATVKLV